MVDGVTVLCCAGVDLLSVVIEGRLGFLCWASSVHKIFKKR